VVSVLASKAGIETMTEAHPDVTIIVGTVDHEVKEDGTVLPGLGDAGDRLFGTPMIDNDNEELLHPSKRKKSY
jgi:uracil phosphoribosyltransferase